VTPGRYYLHAGTPQGPAGFGVVPEPGPNEFRAAYASVFYPGTPDSKFASTIDVLPAVDIRGMDFVVSPIQTVRVRGRVVDAATGQSPEKMRVSLLYTDPVTGFEYSLEPKRRLQENNSPSGGFEFVDVVPGSFILIASEEEAAQRRGRLPIEVADGRNLDDVVVTISSGPSINGRWRIDGQASRQIVSDEFGLGTLGLTAIPSTPGIPERSTRVNPDGTFRFDSVLPGEYQLWGWFRTNLYIKEAHFGAVDLLKNSFRFTGQETGMLDIVISPNLASLEGAVTDDRLAGARGALVVLIPDESQPTLNVKTVRTDQNGRFVIPDIRPGDYKLYAWESIEPNAWFDEDLLRNYQQYARPVHLGELSHQTVDARLIPANKK
jgi:hypothetical protein